MVIKLISCQPNPRLPRVGPFAPGRMTFPAQNDGQLPFFHVVGFSGHRMLSDTAGAAQAITAVLEELRAGGVRYESRSTPPQLRMTPDGLSAVATATTLDTYRHPDGRQVDTSSRSIVHFVRRDGATLIDTIEVFDETAPVGVPPSPPDVR